MFLKMQRNLKLKGERKKERKKERETERKGEREKERKKERKINMNSSGKRKVNWTSQTLIAKETLQINSPSPQETKTERCLKQGYQRRKNTMDNEKSFNPVQQGDGRVQ